jgi:hypothetical protein
MVSFPKGSRALLAWTAVLALALRSLIPAGYMPDFSGAHGLSLTVCDGTDHHMHHHSHDGRGNHTDVCPFSVGALYVLGDIPTPPAATSVFTLSLAAFELPLPHAQAGAFCNASPRSPPSLS